ncbi:alpha/beta fold hydrolase [Streptacidiphilus fuscans]|uniref:Alpha/beta fold hydrolase n=1 Tax=Streptacidiphilus fuscans TaxID=2789292 RepID=A0A931B7M3_9ACTN|nr:alpha/beta fold hydrolase [Streptacidiphilus fuscans]MBF9070152.1 alpha/beta fold hydrolase [Streptacidiphilus fuscans]
MRLFCLPHAGGTSRVFKPWAQILGDQVLGRDVELVPLDVAGRGTRMRENGPGSFADAADDLARIVAERCVGDDYALYGHSMGALLAYEVTHRLAERGCHSPVHLFAAACRPPGYRRPGPMLHSFPDAAFLGALAAFGGLPVEILHDPELIEFYAGLVRDDYRLYEEHAAVVVPRPLACPVSVILGTEDPIAPTASADGWRAVSGGPLTLLSLEGAGHFFDDRLKEIGTFVATSLDAYRAPAVRPEAAELLGRLRLADVRLTPGPSGLAFDAPAGAVDDDLTALMGEHRDELAALVEAGGPVVRSGPPTKGQRRAVVRAETTEAPSALNVAFRLSVSGALDVPRLERALTALTARHGALRTRFARHGGHLVQEQLPPVPFTLDVTNFAGLEGDRLRTSLEEWCLAAARTPFRLGREPLFRASLASAGPRAWELMIVIQHTVSDGWSHATLLEDLSAFYQDGGASLAPLTADLIDFAQWEEDRLSGPNLQALREYWVRLLGDAPLTVDLPSDRPRPKALSGRGGFHDFFVPAPLAEAVRSFALRTRATEFAVFFAVLVLWLGELTGQRDLTVPTNYVNRPRREFEDVVGLFLSNVPIRVRTREGEPLGDLVRRVGAALFENADHFLPLDMLAEELRSVGNPGVGTFPQVVTAVLNTPPLRVSLGDLDVTVTHVPPGGAPGEMCVIFEPEDGGWRVMVPYSADMFDEATVVGMCARYSELLERLMTEETEETEEEVR